jgi:hypothetical protein
MIEPVLVTVLSPFPTSCIATDYRAGVRNRVVAMPSATSPDY